MSTPYYARCAKDGHDWTFGIFEAAGYRRCKWCGELKRLKPDPIPLTDRLEELRVRDLPDVEPDPIEEQTS